MAISFRAPAEAFKNAISETIARPNLPAGDWSRWTKNANVFWAT
jgi:hypothetical protein